MKDSLNKLILKYDYLGVEYSENGTQLIGKAPFLGINAWLNKLYPKLTDEDIIQLKSELKSDIPVDYEDFLRNFSNGLNILSSTFCLYGLRKQIGRGIEASRQPYSLITPNIFEKPKNSKENYFFIGGYNWDGSHLYIDKETKCVHFCKRWDATSLFMWCSFEDMLYSEISRIYLLFDENGKEFNEEISTLP